MKRVPLKRIARVVSGNGFPPALQGVQGEELPFHKVASLSDVQPGGWLDAAQDSISRDTAIDIGASEVPGHSSIMAKIGAATMLQRVGMITRPACIDNNMMAVISRPRTFARYLYYVLHVIALEPLLNPGAVPNLDMGAFRDSRVPPHSFDVQRRIADYLDHETAEIDAFVTELEQFRLLVKERGAARRELAISRSDAEAIPLRRLTPMRATGTSVNASPWPAGEGEVGVLKTGAVSKGYFDPSENKAVLDSEEAKRLTSPVRGDRVLINRANTPSLVGTAVFVPESHPCLYLSDKLWSIDFQASNQYMAEALSLSFNLWRVPSRFAGAWG